MLFTLDILPLCYGYQQTLRKIITCIFSLVLFAGLLTNRSALTHAKSPVADYLDHTLYISMVLNGLLYNP